MFIIIKIIIFCYSGRHWNVRQMKIVHLLLLIVQYDYTNAYICNPTEHQTIVTNTIPLALNALNAKHKVQGKVFIAPVS